MAKSIAELTGDQMGIYKAIMASVSSSIRVAMPGTIQSFDPASQTASVKPSVPDMIQMNGVTQAVALPIISDVPVSIPRGGDFSVTLPVKAGDDCILIFADSCIDSFLQGGGEDAPADIRHHDLSDAMAVVGISTGNAPIPDYSPDKLEIRNRNNNIKITVAEDGIEVSVKESAISITETEIKMSADTVDINGTTF